jgi:alanyl-tRNA synthetase
LWSGTIELKGETNMRLKTFAGTNVINAAVGMAIIAGISFFALIAGISRIEAQTKSAAQQSLDKIIQSLKAVDTAYASGNTAEAQSDFDTANSEWKSVSSKISARESREVQLLFESLQTKLKDKVAPKEISRVVHGTVRELREDIGRELGEKEG